MSLTPEAIAVRLEAARGDPDRALVLLSSVAHEWGPQDVAALLQCPSAAPLLASALVCSSPFTRAHSYAALEALRLPALLPLAGDVLGRCRCAASAAGAPFVARLQQIVSPGAPGALSGAVQATSSARALRKSPAPAADVAGELAAFSPARYSQRVAPIVARSLLRAARVAVAQLPDASDGGDGGAAAVGALAAQVARVGALLGEFAAACDDELDAGRCCALAGNTRALLRSAWSELAQAALACADRGAVPEPPSDGAAPAELVDAAFDVLGDDDCALARGLAVAARVRARVPSPRWAEALSADALMLRLLRLVSFDGAVVVDMLLGEQSAPPLLEFLGLWAREAQRQWPAALGVFGDDAEDCFAAVASVSSMLGSSLEHGTFPYDCAPLLRRFDAVLALWASSQPTEHSDE
eukprot:m51a1_g6370 hypothetical protein (412) ;mRNA; r:123379-124614